MKNILFLLLAISIATACKKPKKTNPNPQQVNYATGRKPLPKWGIDTFITVHGPQNRIDSFYSFVGANGESFIKHNGQQYVFWIDSAYLNAPFTDSVIYANVQIGNSLNDTSGFNKFQIVYHAPYNIYGFDTTLTWRWVDFGEPILNANADDYIWVGRPHD